MGSGQSSDNALLNLYEQYGASLPPIDQNPVALSEEDEKSLSRLCGITGGSVFGGGKSGGTGCGCAVGGYDQIQSYGDSVFSKAKEKLIRDIASDVFQALRLQGSKYAQSAPIADVLKHLEKVIPNPKKGGHFNKDFNKSSSKQKEVCHALGNAINKHYGGNLVPMDASEQEICSKASEVMHSLFTGLHTEFMSVAGDVLRVIRNLESLKEFINASYKKQAELVKASGDPQLAMQSEGVADFYEKIKSELERQLAVLSNLINVSVGPTGKSLISLLEDNRDFSGLVKDIKADVGTNAFGDKLAYLVSGLSTVAHSAELIDKALKKIGMSTQEFKAAKSAGDLRMKIYDHIQKRSPNSKELDAMMAAADIIYKNDYSHKAIAEALSKKGRGVSGGTCGSCTGGSGEDGDSDEEDQQGDADASGTAYGGGPYDYNAEDDQGLPSYWAKKSLSTKINKKSKYRDMLLKDFKKLLQQHYRVIVEAASNISKQVGTAIPVSDDLDKFIDLFSALASLDSDTLHVALSGYMKDSVSKEKRDQFLNNYHLVDVAAEPLTKGPGGQYFRAVQSAIRDLIKTIDNFSDKMVKSITEIHIDKPDEIRSALKQTANQIFGSGVSGGSDDDNLLGSGSFIEFDRVKMEMRYFYSIANIKTNLSVVAQEMKSFSDDYEQILGEESAFIMDSITKEYQALIDDADPEGDKNRAAAIGEFKSVGVEAQVAAGAVGKVGNLLKAKHTGNADNLKNAFNNLRDLYVRQMNAKLEMVRVAQAIDLYMRSFADGIARHPDSIKSVVKMLDQVEIVAKWFTDRSGDNLATLFEFFPCGMNGAVPIYSDGADTIIDKTGKIAKILPDGKDQHYYEWLELKAGGAQAATLPGNPFLGKPLPYTKDGVKGMLALADKTIRSMRALENILSAFATVGSKFGDLNPQSSTFMNPGQIFNALCEYILTSAFTTDFMPSAAEIAAVYRGAIANQQYAGANMPATTTPSNFRVVKADAANMFDSESKAIEINTTTAGLNPITDNSYGVIVGISNMTVAQATAAITAAQNVVTTHGGAATADEKKALADAQTAEAEIKADTPLNKLTSIAMSAIPADSDSKQYWAYHNIANRGKPRADVAGWLDRFYDTDLLFQMTVKSIVCKVFTTVDAYRLFNRPMKAVREEDKNAYRHQYDSLNPLRTILGGADGGSVGPAKVIPEALELYLRLPLLAEWYRDKFATKLGRTEPATAAGNTDVWRLTLVPSIDGIWSGIILLLFDKAEYVEQGNYTEPQAKKLIEEINDIHKHYKSRYPRATVRSILNAFVLEINRAFGFVKQAEIETYLNSRRDFLDNKNDNYDKDNERDFNNYDILSADDQYGRNPAPSDKFTTVAHKVQKRKERNMVHLQEEVLNIRQKMDKEFLEFSHNAQVQGKSPVNFIETLRTYKKDLENASSDKEKYAVVLRLIQGANNLTATSADKLIMVHEAVAAPLAALYNVYKVLAKYNAFLHGTALDNIVGWSQARVKHAAGAGVDEAAQINSLASRTAAYVAYLKTKYPNDAKPNGDKMIAKFAAVAIGKNDSYIRANSTADTTLAIANVDAGELLKDLFSALLELCTNQNKLITCSVASNGVVNVDWNALEEVCLGLLQQVKSNISKLRFEFTGKDSILEKYESREYTGSSRWLDENLVEILLKDRDKTGLPSAHNLLNPTLDILLGKRPISWDGTTAAAIPAFPSYAAMLQQLIYYNQRTTIYSLPNDHVTNDLTTFPFNVLPVMVDELALTPEQKSTLQSLKSKSDVLKDTANSILAAPIIYFESPETINDWNLTNELSKSLMMTFNKAVHMYLRDNLDDNSLKIYTPLFESFMNSSASREIVQNEAFPNVGTMQNGIYGHPSNRATDADQSLQDPPNGVVLFASTALTIKALMSNMDMRLKKKKHIYDSLADVPEYMKERMKCNLPYYSKIFTLVYERSELLKLLLNNTDVKKSIAHTTAGDSGVANMKLDTGKQLQNLNPATSDVMLAHFNSLLVHLSELALSIKKCCDGVYKELQDTAPYFMELSKDFISDYKQRYGVLPVMPASDVLLPQMAFNGAYVTGTATTRAAAAIAANRTLSIPLTDAARAMEQRIAQARSRFAKLRNEFADKEVPVLAGTTGLAPVVNTGGSDLPLSVMQERVNVIAAQVKQAATADGFNFATEEKMPTAVKQIIKNAAAAIAGTGADVAYTGKIAAALAAALVNMNTQTRLLRKVGVVAAKIREYGQTGKLQAAGTDCRGGIPLAAGAGGGVHDAARNAAAAAASPGNIADAVTSLANGGQMNGGLTALVNLAANLNVDAALGADGDVKTQAIKDAIVEKVQALVDGFNAVGAELTAYTNDTSYNTAYTAAGQLPIELAYKNENYPNFEKMSADIKTLVDQYNAEMDRTGQTKIAIGGYTGGADAAEVGRLAWSKADEQRLLLPTNMNGSTPYKFNLAGRMLLARSDVDVQLDHMPGAKDLYNGYAAVAQKHSMISQQEYANTVKLLVRLARFLNDGAVYSRLFDKASINEDPAVIVGTYLSNSMSSAMLCASKQIADVHVPTAATPANLAVINAVLADAKVVLTAANAAVEFPKYRAKVDPVCYQFSNRASDVLGMSENTSKQAAKEILAKFMKADTVISNDRAHLRVANILDMGIVPINFHAFMKEVPFTNLLNYSYTFDRMVHDFVIPSYVATKGGGADFMIGAESDVSSTREMLVKLLVKPFANLSSDAVKRAKQYYALIGSLFNGNDGLKLGRPRYLSDQLWHKVLLTSSVQFAHGSVTKSDPAASGDNADDAFNTTRPLLESVSAYEATRAMARYTNRATAVDVGFDTHEAKASAKRGAVNNLMNATPGLKFYKNNNWVTSPHANQMPSANVAYCAEVGKMRFDTKLVRNLVWLVQLQRIMRVVLINHLSWLDTPVVKGLKIADSTITEYNANDAFSNDDYTGSRYDVI